jgi:hypothetical protein
MVLGSFHDALSIAVLCGISKMRWWLQPMNKKDKKESSCSLFQGTVPPFA